MTHPRGKKRGRKPAGQAPAGKRVAPAGKPVAPRRRDRSPGGKPDKRRHEGDKRRQGPQRKAAILKNEPAQKSEPALVSVAESPRAARGKRGSVSKGPQIEDLKSQEVERTAGRPTTYTDELAAKICELIETIGMHATPAAASLGVPDSTLSQWRKDRPEFEAMIRQAEGAHMRKRLEQVGTAVSIEEKDAKTLRWFLERRWPDLFGAKAAPVTVNNNIGAPVVLTPEQLESLQERRRAALAGQNRSSVPKT